MGYSVIIPSRYQSTRLPGKALVDIKGKPMIQRVYEQVKQSRASRIFIATDDHRIYKACENFGANAIMTSPDHTSGTDRIFEVVDTLRLPASEVIINVQGDEPLIPPEVIDQLAQNLALNYDLPMATLYEPIKSLEDLTNPNVVKLLHNHQQHATYFSRAPIPWPREHFSSLTNTPILPQDYTWLRHIGIYAYRASFLKTFTEWEAPAIEKQESLEQLRAIYYGATIHASQAVKAIPPGVDTPEDLARVIALIDG